MGSPRSSPRLLTLAVLASCVLPTDSHANIDGGRSDLPGMKQDMFDQVKKNKQNQHMKKGKVPECPKSDHMSPFYSLAFANNEIFVRLNSTEGKCSKLITIGGANYSELTNYSKTCGPAGEWKKRIAEELSAMFFQGGLTSWVKSENESIEVVTEDGTFEVEVNEQKYEIMLDCWKRSCGCEQANNPIARMVMMAMLVIAIGGLGFDSFKVLWDKFSGKKPAKHVQCKKGHKMEEVKAAPRNYCDLCGQAGTTYQCSVSCNYDLCKVCYKASKKKQKDELAAWLEKHPDDPDNKKDPAEKKDKKKKDKGSDKEDDEKSGSEAPEKDDDQKSGKSEDNTEKSDTEADKSEKSEDKDEDE
jgi:hypothetical protein